MVISLLGQITGQIEGSRLARGRGAIRAWSVDEFRRKMALRYGTTTKGLRESREEVRPEEENTRFVKLMRAFNEIWSILQLPKGKKTVKEKGGVGGNDNQSFQKGRTGNRGKIESSTCLELLWLAINGVCELKEGGQDSSRKPTKDIAFAENRRGSAD